MDRFPRSDYTHAYEMHIIFLAVLKFPAEISPKNED